LFPETNRIAITQRTSQKLFGNENPIGEEVSLFDKRRIIGTVVSDFSEHSNFPFDVLSPVPSNSDPYSQWMTFVKLKRGVNKKIFNEKLINYKTNLPGIEAIELTPITAYRYIADSNFKQIITLAIVGALVVLCSLLNYLTLFVGRFRIRRKELALRIVSGATKKSFFTLFSVEFFAPLLVSFLLGCVFTESIYPYFQKISNLPLKLSDIFLEVVVYIVVIIVVAFILFGALLIIFQRRSLSASLQKDKHIFRNGLVVFQLAISIGFIFCTTIIIKQIHFISNTDIGFEYKNRAAFRISGIPVEEIEIQVRKIPEITDCTTHHTPLIPMLYSGAFPVSEWEGKCDNSTNDKVLMDVMEISENFMNFYRIRPVSGDVVLRPSDKESCILINESAAKALGWKNPVGKTLKGIHNGVFTVKGVVKDIYPESAKQQSKPIMFIYLQNSNVNDYFLFKYKEGTWEKVKYKIETMMKNNYPNKDCLIFNAEEKYKQMIHFSREEELIKILGFCSLVCVIVAVFGFFSLVLLTCDEREKEIAIRKINGATTQNILSMLLKTYFLLIFVGAVIVFPIAYYIMNRWLQNYGKQTAINWWVYLIILLSLGIIILLTIIGQVYKTSNKNPAEVVKKE